jgi:hypothetical protein
MATIRLTRMALEPAGYTIHATQFEIRYYEDCVQIQNLIPPLDPPLGDGGVVIEFGAGVLSGYVSHVSCMYRACIVNVS